MKTRAVRQLALCGLTLLASCDAAPQLPADPPIETGFSFTNFSTRFYAALRIRPHRASEDVPFDETPLMPPGASLRRRFVDAVGEGCPDALDLEVRLYQRVNDDLPIGLDADETIDPEPVAASFVEAIPACGVQTLETFTIVNWDAAPSVGRVKLAQSTPIDDAIRRLGLFPNEDAAWEFTGVDPALAGAAPPPLPPKVTLRGGAVRADGTPVPGVGVLLRTRFRARLSDSNPTNDPDAGFGPPIAVTTTNESGTFAFDRPAGGYRIEFFSDDFAFRPVVIDVESPSQAVVTIVEPRP